jgi:hypothetical protein
VIDVDQIIKYELDHDFFSKYDFVCEIRRVPQLLHLCGYVYIPYGHNYYGRDTYDIKVHGGITLAEQDKDEWKIGFDCGHSGDLIPAMKLSTNGTWREGPTYKDWDYVEREVEKMAWFISLAASEDERKNYKETIDDRLAKKLLSL